MDSISVAHQLVGRGVISHSLLRNLGFIYWLDMGYRLLHQHGILIHLGRRSNLQYCRINRALWNHLSRDLLIYNIKRNVAHNVFYMYGLLVKGECQGVLCIINGVLKLLPIDCCLSSVASGYL